MAAVIPTSPTATAPVLEVATAATHSHNGACLPAASVAVGCRPEALAVLWPPRRPPLTRGPEGRRRGRAPSLALPDEGSVEERSETGHATATNGARLAHGGPPCEGRFGQMLARSGLGVQDADEVQLQRWLAQEEGERDASRIAFQRLHGAVDVYRQRLAALRPQPDGARVARVTMWTRTLTACSFGDARFGYLVPWPTLPGDPRPSIARARELLQSMEAEVASLRSVQVPHPPSRVSTYEVLSQSLKETQRQCEALNQEMVQQADGNEKLLESMGSVKAANKGLLEQIRSSLAVERECGKVQHGSQQSDLAQLTQQCVGCEERLEQLRKRQDMEREQSRIDGLHQVALLREAWAERRSEVQQLLTQQLRSVQLKAVSLQSSIKELSGELKARRQESQALAAEVAAWFSLWQQDVPAQLLEPFRRRKQQKVERLMDESSSEEEEEEVTKRRRVEAPEVKVQLKVMSLAGKTLLQLPCSRSMTLGVLKEMIEAALHMPRSTQRLLTAEPKELKEERPSARLGRCWWLELKVDLTLVKQKPETRTLFDEAKLGNGSSCLALLKSPDLAELVNYVHAEHKQSCLHAAAQQRLSATCHAILRSPHFQQVNLQDNARYSALDYAVRSNLPDVCEAIMSRDDFEGPDKSLLLVAILKGLGEVVCTLAPRLPREILLEPEIQATWATLDPEQGRRVAKMQNAALSTLSCFQAILVRDNVRGPKITKLCRFPVERHLNAPGTETVTAFNTHFARTTLINSCAQTPIVLSWPTGPNVLTQLSSAGVPESALQTSDAKVATARALFRDLRLVLHDGPPHGAPWHGDSAPGVDSSPATTKRPRTVAVPLPSAAGGLPAPTPPGAMPGAFGV
eukprot:g14763.t1